MSGYTPKCDCCGRFFRAGQPGSSWSQSWSWDMGGTPDLHDPTDRCAPCTDLYGVEPSNCANPENYSGRHALEGRLPMTPPETSDQGNMVSQRQVEWVLVPREPTEAMIEAAKYHWGPWIDAEKTQRAGRYDANGGSRARAVWEQMLSAAPPAEPRADEGGVSQSHPVFGSVPLPTREAEEPAALLKPGDVEWIVNDTAELGVKIGQQFFFCYKGGSLVYEDPHHEDGSPMHWRPVFKREFGECVHPVNRANPLLIGTVSLDDSDEWQPLPALSTEASPLGAEPAADQAQAAADHYRAEWEREAAQTRAIGEEPCEGCGKPGVVVDINGCDLCQDCADGCKIEETH